ncbi:hypothetical protein AC249_AIPGENE20898 [Exaiptasia diaphana]|nr:hypothetical protein AC249_AIPGENE20898 [Exaiptasia diaphana]
MIFIGGLLLAVLPLMWLLLPRKGFSAYDCFIGITFFQPALEIHAKTALVAAIFFAYNRRTSHTSYEKIEDK